MLIVLFGVFSVTVVAQDAKAVRFIVEHSDIQALDELKANSPVLRFLRERCNIRRTIPILSNSTLWQ